MDSAQNIKGEHLFLLMLKAWNAVDNYDNQSIKALGFSSLSDFIVLEALLHKGPLPVSAIGQKAMLTSGSITTAVDRAEKNGCVLRERDAKDGRIVNVALTDKGRSLITRAFKAHATNLRRLFDVLTEEEKNDAARLFKKIGKAAEAMAL